jgi:hypothetical protein
MAREQSLEEFLVNISSEREHIVRAHKLMKF